MIVYRRHDEIDKVRWDECIRNSVNRLPYGMSWFLDIVSPGWEALEMNGYESVMPLTQGRKFGIRYLYQPFFTQQLGVFSRDHLTAGLVDEFLSRIPGRFSLGRIHLNSMNRPDENKYRIRSRMNLELDLISSYDVLFGGYHQNTRRNLRKALDQQVAICRKTEPDELIALFAANFGKNEKSLKFRHYEMLRGIMQYGLHRTFSIILGARLPDGSLCAGAFLLRDGERFIYQMAATDRRARDNGAMTLLIDTFIREQCGQNLILDFEGSSDPDVARFYKGFGARESVFHEVEINRLPGFARGWINFRRNARQ